ncbi:hypothetical protein O6P43_025925 [Quillaja saponaria]|uniref:Uncharacterized protein n=1 Tax=Quillaja saponaria TaxID=32244 RepID=A0AAD7LA15_QUISA|nr:hypothetical protein O6P43_025925 [Quillaja saponaria]
MIYSPLRVCNLPAYPASKNTCSQVPDNKKRRTLRLLPRSVYQCHTSAPKATAPPSEPQPQQHSSQPPFSSPTPSVSAPLPRSQTLYQSQNPIQSNNLITISYKMQVTALEGSIGLNSK